MAITRSQITAKNYKLFNESEEGNSNRGKREDFLAVAKHKDYKGQLLNESVSMLQWYPETDLLRITDYWNEPIRFREYYYIGYVTNQAELDEVFEKLNFEIESINLDELTTKYT